MCMLDSPNLLVNIFLLKKSSIILASAITTLLFVTLSRAWKSHFFLQILISWYSNLIMVKVHNLPHHNHSGQCSQMQFFEDLDQGSGWPTGRRCHCKNIDGWKYFGALIETSTWSWTLGWGRQPTRPLYLEARGEHISDRAYWRIFDRGYMTEDIWHRIYDHPSAISFFLDPHDITRYFAIWYDYHTILAIFYVSWSVQNLSQKKCEMRDMHE